MISIRQIKILQSLLSKRFGDREERMAFLSGFVGRELATSKELKEIEAFEILDYLGYNYSFAAHFDSHNMQHLSLLAKCHELGWVQVDNPRIPDLQRLGKFMLSKRCPVQKPLMEMTTKEVSNHTHGKTKLRLLEEIFEEYMHFTKILVSPLGWQMTFPTKNGKIRKNNSRIEEKRCKKKFW
ncbi:MAG: hypothetical protein ACFNS7_05835 [Capnocytophaga granulosa]